MNYPEIRAAYPNPSSAWDGTDATRGTREDYCVGGAVCMAFEVKYPRRDMNDAIRFPDPGMLCMVLNVECRVPMARAMRAADQIIDLNDAGYFDEAWSVLEEVMG